MKNTILSFIASFFIATSPVLSQPQSVLITASELIDPEQLLDIDLITRCAIAIASEVKNNNNDLIIEEITPIPVVRQGMHGTIITTSTSTGALQLYCMHNIKKILIDILLFDQNITEDQKKAISKTILNFFSTSRKIKGNTHTFYPKISIKTINR